MDSQVSNSPFLTNNGRKTIKREYGNKVIEFELYTEEETKDLNVSGIYIFLKSSNDSIDIYIGQSECFANRFKGHKRWDEARKLGADCIAFAKIDFSKLDEIEKNLIQERKPILNEQHNTNPDERKINELRTALKKEFLQRD